MFMGVIHRTLISGMRFFHPTHPETEYAAPGGAFDAVRGSALQHFLSRQSTLAQRPGIIPITPISFM
jgi:hypothetical protein